MNKEKDLLKDVLEEMLDEKEEFEEDIKEEVKKTSEEFEDIEEIEDEFDEFEEDDEEDEEDYLDLEDGEEDEDEFTPSFKKTREDRAHHAFEKLRKENKEKEERLAELDELADAYGFTSRDAMLEQLRNDAYARQAKAENINPEIYRTLKEQERELNRIKEEREQERMQLSAQTVKSRIDTFSDKYNLSEDDVEKLVSDLDSDGFTIEHLARVRNYEKLFTGYMKDTIVESERQKRLDREKRKRKLAESKLDSSGRDEQYTLDDLIESTIAKNKTIY